MGAVGSHGYGAFWIGGGLDTSHRAAWRLTRGSIPAGLQVLHHCDNRRCVRPDHLFLGSQSDNMRDCERKGRHVSNWPHRRGERAAGAKLTDAQAAWFKRAVRQGEMTQAAARAVLGISSAHASRIANGLRRAGSQGDAA